jgi:hypothetical protein
VLGGLTKVEAGALLIAAAMASARTVASPAAWQEIPHRAAALAWETLCACEQAQRERAGT